VLGTRNCEEYLDNPRVTRVVENCIKNFTSLLVAKRYIGAMKCKLQNKSNTQHARERRIKTNPSLLRSKCRSRSGRKIVVTCLLAYSKEQCLCSEVNRFSASQEIPRILWNPTVHHRP